MKRGKKRSSNKKRFKKRDASNKEGNLLHRKRKNEENDAFSIVPLDLKVDILMKLPPRSIARLGFVSKHRSSVINGKYFTELYLTRSSTQPRLLFSVYRGRDDMFFTSCSQEDPSSDHRRVSYTLKSSLRYLPYTFSSPVRGLICGRNKTRVIVGNPSTGQFVWLPGVERRSSDVLSVFGYDPFNDLYKVLLCMHVITKHRVARRVGLRDVSFDLSSESEEHHVITLGAKEKWRMIECEYPHRHYSGSNGICRDGVLYYLAYFKQERSLMSFDMRSEEFNVTKLPKFGNLVNLTGKITIGSQAAYNGQIELWVLEDAKKDQVWSKAASVFPSWVEVFGSGERFMFRGICSYDLKKKSPRKVVIEGIEDVSAANIQVFSNHVESHMLV